MRKLTLNIQEFDTSKKIVIISYATYPGNAPRQIRTHQLTKELSRRGHDVTLYVLTSDYDYRDYLDNNNIKVKSLGKTYFFKYSHKTGATLNFPMKVIKKLIGKFFEFPAIELMFNTYAAIKKESNADLLITIGAPHTIHWGAALFRTLRKEQLKKTTWVADCGDPYMGNPFSKKPVYFKYVEKWFFRKADFVTIPIEEAREAYYSEFSNKIKIIPQGFELDKPKVNTKIIKNNIPTFIYAGNFYEGLRDPRPFLEYLKDLGADFKFIVYTKDSYLLAEFQKILGNKLEVFNYIPREQLILKMSEVDFLVNFENPSITQSPSKLIDYALSKRPILSLNTNSTLDTSLINQFLAGDYTNTIFIKNIEDYDIRNVTNKFLSLLDNLNTD